MRALTGLACASVLIFSGSMALAAKKAPTYETCQQQGIKLGMDNQARKNGPSPMDTYIRRCMAGKT